MNMNKTVIKELVKIVVIGAALAGNIASARANYNDLSVGADITVRQMVDNIKTN